MAAGPSRSAIGLVPALTLGVLTLAGLGLAGLILARAPAQHAAARSLSDSAAVHEVLAGRNRLARGEPPSEIAASARRILDRAPLEAGAVSLLGLSLPEARRLPLMEAAARLSHRDEAADRWLFEAGMARGDYAAALRRADALMRRQTAEQRVAVVRRIFPYLGEPAAFAAVIDRLALSPAWRGAFLAQFTALSPDAGEPYRILKALRATAAPPTRVELSAYLRRLIAERRFQQAHRDWIALAPAAERAGTALLADGGFEGLPATPPFGWNLDSHTAGYGEMLPSERDGGKALRVSHDGRTRQWLVRQLLVLAPGAYRLSGQVRTASDLSADSMAWTLTCEGVARPLASTPAPATGGGWAGFSVAFTVPAEGCEGQSLVLQSLPADSGTPVEVWYDALVIERTAPHAR
ncbi:MAG TPA: hypothetical protein VEA44_10335 [Caulobacter sp.]|nr:hypothetical protein [Caulobacter sp.]